MEERQRPPLKIVFQPLKACNSRNTTSRGPRKVIGLIFVGILHFAGWSSGRNPTPYSLPAYQRSGLFSKGPSGQSFLNIIESIKSGSQSGSRYVCLTCSGSEEIPLSVVRDFDMMDDGDPEVPPQFRCEACGGEMYPEYYKGVHGYEHRLSDRLVSKEAAQSSE